MRLPLDAKWSIGWIVIVVALVAIAATIVAVAPRRAVATRRLEAHACAGVTIPTAPAGSSIALISKGEPETTALLVSGSPALIRAGATLRAALEESDNAKPVIAALSEAAKACKALGLHVGARS